MGIAGTESFNYFLHDSKALPYNRLPYNNCSERAIEVPLAVSFLQERGAGIDEAYLEIGNVLANYQPILDEFKALGNRNVLDKFEEAPGVLNVDLMDYDVHYANIVCLSTVEHIGQRAYGENKPGDRGAPLLALRHIYNLLRPDGEALITVPYGKLMDFGWLIQFSGDYLDLLTSRYGVPSEAVRVSYFRKLDMEMTFNVPRQTWVQCEREELANTRFDHPFIFANGIAVIRLRKLGPDIVSPPPASAAKELDFYPPAAIGSLYALPFVRSGSYDLDGFIPAASAGYVFYGPNIALKPQTYRLEAVVDVAGRGRFTLELTADSGRKLLWSRSFDGTGRLSVELPIETEEREVEIRLYKHNDSECRVRAPVLLLEPANPIAV